MQERKLNVGFAFFPYGGNGSTSSEVPDIRDWFAETLIKAKGDSRIEEIHWKNFSDTPITMTRNQAVLWARSKKVDVLVMVDSDMGPDCELDDDPTAKPFFETSFDFIYKRWDEAPTVVCAPYCGPPPLSPVYVFYWASSNLDAANVGMRLKMYEREEAEKFSSIHPVGALPTGLIMWDMRAFELTDPKTCETKDGWFYYEWTDDYAAEKNSTEDVTATRDISLAGQALLGKDVIFCNWDAWATHWKPLAVRKPRSIHADYVSKKFKKAVELSNDSSRSLTFVRCNTEQGGAKPNLVYLGEGDQTLALDREPKGTLEDPLPRKSRVRKDWIFSHKYNLWHDPETGEWITPELSELEDDERGEEN